MSIEKLIEENTNALKALVVAIASLSALPAAAGAATTDAKPGKTETKKAETKKDEPKAVEWKDVLDAIKAVNASKEDGRGRVGVEAIVAKFGKAGEKVPTLEAVGKHAEILAFAKEVLANGLPAEESGEELF